MSFPHRCSVSESASHSWSCSKLRSSPTRSGTRPAPAHRGGRNGLARPRWPDCRPGDRYDRHLPNVRYVLIGVTLMFFLSGGNVVPAIIPGVAVASVSDSVPT